MWAGVFLVYGGLFFSQTGGGHGEKKDARGGRLRGVVLLYIIRSSSLSLSLSVILTLCLSVSLSSSREPPPLSLVFADTTVCCLSDLSNCDV